jgi:hypothetical protein
MQPIQTPCRFERFQSEEQVVQVQQGNVQWRELLLRGFASFSDGRGYLPFCAGDAMYARQPVQTRAVTAQPGILRSGRMGWAQAHQRPQATKRLPSLDLLASISSFRLSVRSFCGLGLHDRRSQTCFSIASGTSLKYPVAEGVHVAGLDAEHLKRFHLPQVSWAAWVSAQDR